MGNPYVGEIRMFAGNFAPLNWRFCDGSLIPISENTALFTLLGTTYGGDGQNTFGLPNLLGRVPVHQGTWQGVPSPIGQLAGTETVTLTVGQMPQHTHAMNSSASNPQASPSNALPGVATASNLATYTYGPLESHSTNLSSSSIKTEGSSLPHTNMQPFLAVNFIISLFGVYPPQN